MDQGSKQNGSTRRGFFRRAGLIAAVSAALSGAAWHAYAHGGPGHGRGFFGGDMQGAPSEEHMERMLKRIYGVTNATPEQQQRIAPIVKQAITELAPLRQQMQGTREQARNIMSAPQIDRAALEQLRASRLQTADAISRRVTQAMADVGDVLTPEQRKALGERMQRRGGRGHGEHQRQRG
jgi:Spy/CpxP family protein refolding chaperone